ncbi:MAG: hypothetical protein WC889_10760 [Myxococcota bacterium]
MADMKGKTKRAAPVAAPAKRGDLYVNVAGLGGLIGILICSLLVISQPRSIHSRYDFPKSRSMGPLAGLLNPWDAEVGIDELGVYLDGELMEPNMEDYKNISPPPPALPGLLKGFQIKAAILAEKSVVQTNEQIARKAVIIVDKKVPFWKLQLVMKTCKQAGFDKMEFKVLREGYWSYLNFH